ncbi:MAG: DUF2993 domain-containing protein [Frankiaceae bacterium]
MFRRVLVGVAVVLSAGAVAVDRVAASVAGKQVAKRLQTAESLPSTLKVTLGGFPFLTQALRGRYHDVSVTATDVRRGSVLVARIDARLHGVRLGLREALGGSIDAVPVDSVDATALFRYADLSAAVPNGRLTITEDHGRIRLHGATVVFGQRISGSGLGEVSVEANRLTIVPVDFTLDTGGRTMVLNPALAAALTYSVPINLPFGLTLRSVQPRSEGLAVQAVGNAIVLRR